MTNTAQPSGRSLLAVTAVGAAVSLSLGAYSRLHTPTGERIVSLGFPNTLAMKAWLATFAMIFVIIQVISALWMYRKLPGVGKPPAAIGPIHRWSGTFAFLLTLPVAYHCLWSFGAQTYTTRVAVHSVFGCLFYGIFATKMLTLRSERISSRVLPIVGGLLATVLTVLWLTSSLWYFRNFA